MIQSFFLQYDDFVYYFIVPLLAALGGGIAKWIHNKRKQNLNSNKEKLE